MGNIVASTALSWDLNPGWQGRKSVYLPSRLIFKLYLGVV